MVRLDSQSSQGDGPFGSWMMQQQSIVQLSMVYEAVIPWKEPKELEEKGPGSTGMQSLSQRELQRVAHHYRRQGME